MDPAPLDLWITLHGEKANDEVIRDAVRRLRAEDARIRVRVTWEPGDATAFASEAAQMGCPTVVACGGDGTINETLQGLITNRRPSSTALGVVAMGTANDFARACELPVRDPLAALQLIHQHPPQLIDVALANGRPFLNVASGGYGAEITNETPAEIKRMLGGFAYFLTGITHASTIVPQEIAVSAPDFNWKGEVLALTVANGRQAGGGFQVAPQALLDDGLLDVMIIPNVPWGNFLSLVGDLIEDPDSVDMEHVVRLRTPWLEVTAPAGLHVNVDGEPLDDNFFRFEVLPKSLPLHLLPGIDILSR
ncbi:lipid kinase YegS [Lignipirellula cremea]|uniref:Putative lipid kinase YegS n=1 Tax=Lignipirellula cremea TaxID=2528010 RepID=A0A518DNT0_9BACT|nr:lipid kinase YegS [Lignipirellula cremea]QDU93495.1 putative lipid kinase YegS [Lignipirellula cremea]